jgi:hypothetical protein
MVFDGGAGSVSFLNEHRNELEITRNDEQMILARCDGSVSVIACIEDQDVIDQILAHLRETEKEAPARPLLVPPTRAPPATLSLFAGMEFNQQGRH